MKVRVWTIKTQCLGYKKPKSPKFTENIEKRTEQVRPICVEIYLHYILSVILYEPLDGVVEDGSKGVFLGFYSLRELVGEVMSDAADE